MIKQIYFLVCIHVKKVIMISLNKNYGVKQHNIKQQSKYERKTGIWSPADQTNATILVSKWEKCTHVQYCFRYKEPQF